MEIALISYLNDFSLIPSGKYASWRSAAKKSNFENFERALYTPESGRVPLNVI